MKKRLTKTIIITLVLGLFLASPDFALGISGEVQVLNDKISQEKSKLDQIREKQEEYTQIITQKQKEKNTLANELAILESRVARAELEIEGVEIEMNQINLEIRKINVDIKNKEDQMEKEKQHMSNLLNLVYKQGQASVLEILLLNESLNDFLDQMKYLENTNSEIGQSLEKLKNTKESLEKNKDDLQLKAEELSQAKEKLESQKNALEYEKNNQAFILNKTRESERQYQNLLASVKAEQEQAEAEIVALEREIRERMAAENQESLGSRDTGFMWAVTRNYITSVFHDPDYPFRTLIGEHSGIDIRAAQGTTLKATASGYVARVKFDSTSSNYGYIMIIHDDGLSSVYGHISAVSVKADQYVAQGQVIGKTGGTPGTAGSGRFSSGPHLHFEIRQDGLPVNPQDYLP